MPTAATQGVQRLRSRIAELEAELRETRAQLASAESATTPEGWYVSWAGPKRSMGWMHRVSGQCWWISPGSRPLMDTDQARDLWRRTRGKLVLCEVCGRQ